jgi:hypothetical protein
MKRPKDEPVGRTFGLAKQVARLRCHIRQIDQLSCARSNRGEQRVVISSEACKTAMPVHEPGVSLPDNIKN